MSKFEGYNLNRQGYAGSTGFETIENQNQQFFNNLIWSLDDVCEFTNYAKGTIYNFVSRGEIPYRRGRRRKLIFIPNEIIDWLKGE